MTPITIPVRENEEPIQLSIPKMSRLDKCARVLLGTGIGIAVAGAVASLLKGDDDNKDTRAEDGFQPFDEQ